MAQHTSKYEKLKARVANMKEKGQEALGSVLQSAEVGGSAFAFGYMRGRMGDDNGEFDVVGIPASLGAAVAFHGMGFLGLFGKHSEHAHNLGDGALAEYAAVAGMRMGNAKSSNPGVKRIAGTSGGRRPAIAGSNPFAQNNGFSGFARGNIQNPFVRAA